MKLWTPARQRVSTLQHRQLAGDLVIGAHDSMTAVFGILVSTKTSILVGDYRYIVWTLIY